MGKLFDAISDEHREFIERQPVFFVGTAATEGRVNVSPKGLDALRVISPNEVAWLNLTGSGNESAAHVRLNPRMTIMFMSFERQPLILRLFGLAQMIQRDHVHWAEEIARFGSPLSARQVYRLNVDSVQTSCGFGVPRMSLEDQRDTLPRWAEAKGPEGIADYQRERNAVSLDGFETGIVVD